jgi:hypothetical protein
MFKKLSDTIKAINYGVVLSVVLILVGVYFAIKETPLGTLTIDGIQNRLVWNIKGECYFVKPAANTVYLVRVEDCDKGVK